MTAATSRPAKPSPGENDLRRQIGTFVSRWWVLGVVVLLGVGFAISSPVFLTPGNLLNIAGQASIVGIVAIGVTFVMVAGEIDISVSGIAPLTGMLCALLMTMGVNMWLAIAAGLCVGLVLGFINGVLTTILHLPSMIVTLGTMYLGQGLANILTGGTAIYGLPDEFLFVGRGRVFGLPMPFLILIVLGAIAVIILSFTVFGRHVYAIGGNQTVARLAGVPVNRSKISYFVICGVGGSLAAILLTSQVASGQPSTGMSLNMLTITAVVIGGAALSGGKGTIQGSLLGALLLTVLTNGLNLNGISSFWQSVVSAVVLILTIVANRNK
ncbi:MAG: ABC transporter permease [Propionicimonas sp.]|uniref:ABC transporter permease n=1 Tax=Propionicimonas sp. TaxID=1955623 RepID=UPI002B21AA58|nr:ABC transporter permease [Propionicimonas sp.]MEA4944960.1 ABC transporter permease [Propionicimonas sp.]MEA5054919.1 ABC transporter permease [Propionicimonas sp.]MEA5116960.1 ABC transporter permease [Propionicimonas sp.]